MTLPYHWEALLVVIACLWYVLGDVADRVCRRQAKKRGEAYRTRIRVACYAFGIAVVPAAFLFGFTLAFFRMFKS